MQVTTIALIGGIYSNYHALLATLADIDRRGADCAFLARAGTFSPGSTIPWLRRSIAWTPKEGNF